jgi:hypothetical protein
VHGCLYMHLPGVVNLSWVLQATEQSHALRFTAYEKAAPPSDAAPAADAPASIGTGAAAQLAA